MSFNHGIQFSQFSPIGLQHGLRVDGCVSYLRVGHLKGGLLPKEQLEGAGAGAGAGIPIAEAGDAYLYFPMGRGMSSLTQSMSWTDHPPDG